MNGFPPYRNVQWRNNHRYGAINKTYKSRLSFNVLLNRINYYYPYVRFFFLSIVYASLSSIARTDNLNQRVPNVSDYRVILTAVIYFLTGEPVLAKN